MTLFPIALLGAIAGLDVVSFPQAMISRPIVAATVGGAFAGNAGAGLLVGAAVELIALETLPVGASVIQVGIRVGRGRASWSAAGRSRSVPVTILAALATAWVGGWSMIALRKWNAVRARAHLADLERGSASTVNALQLWGLTADLARGAALTVISYSALRPVVDAAAVHWRVDARTSRALVVGAAAAVAVAAVWKVFHWAPFARVLFGAGLIGGVALVVWS